MTSAASVVLTSAVSWTGTHARAQHFATRLAQRGWDVVFVDGPITWLSPLKNRELLHRLIPSPAVREIAVSGTGRLQILSPVANLPFGNLSRQINQVNQWSLAQQINQCINGPSVLLPMLPTSADLTRHLRPLATLYDCVDLHAEFRGLLNPATVYQMEYDLVRQSRVVFATAGALQERLCAWHSDVRLVPNAAEISHFARTPNLPEHPALAGIPKPRVGYVGGIGSWVDQDLLFDMATARPNVQLVMIGPAETDVSRLQSLPNVHFLGLQPYSELPEFLSGFDVAIHSFLQNELTQSVNPIKIYEYLASGREVIATHSRELDRLDSLLWLIRNADDGIAALDKILAGEHRTESHEREAFILQHSWDARVDEVERAIRASVPPHLHPPEA